MCLLRVIIFVFPLIIVFPVYGKRILKIPYLQFEIAENWKCRSFGPYWLCHHRFHQSEKPALIMVTGKLKKSSDTTDFYGRVFGQKPSGTSPVIVNRQTWLQTLYQSGLIVNRYVGTVCCKKMEEKVYILIGFHAREESYAKYNPQFLRSIKTLRLPPRLKKTFLHLREQTPEERQQMLAYMANLFSEEDFDSPSGYRTSLGSSLWVKFVVAGLVALSGFLYYMYYKKQKRRKKRRRKRSSRHRR